MSMQGMLALNSHLLRIAIRVGGESGMGAKNLCTAENEIRSFRDWQIPHFKDAFCELTSKVADLKHRDIDIKQVVKPKLKKGQKDEGEYILRFTIAIKNPQQRLKIVKKVFKMCQESHVPKTGLAWKLRDCGVKHLLSHGKAADFNPTVRLVSKLQCETPITSYMILRHLVDAPLSLAHMEMVSTIWRLHSSWVHDDFWRLVCELTFVSRVGKKQLKFAEECYEEDPYEVGWKKEPPHYPWKQAYAEFHHINCVCRHVKWHEHEDGSKEPAWTTEQWEELKSTTQLIQGLCPAFVAQPPPLWVPEPELAAEPEVELKPPEKNSKKSHRHHKANSKSSKNNSDNDEYSWTESSSETDEEEVRQMEAEAQKNWETLRSTDITMVQCTPRSLTREDFPWLYETRECGSSDESSTDEEELEHQRKRAARRAEGLDSDSEDSEYWADPSLGSYKRWLNKKQIGEHSRVCFLEPSDRNIN